MIKSRSASPSAAPAPSQSIEAVRRRARHRLIGASVLVLVGVVGFSLLFDTQPRPLAVDIPIEIPAKASPAASAPAATVVATPSAEPASVVQAPAAPAPVVEAVRPAPPPQARQAEAAPAPEPTPAPVLAPAAPPEATQPPRAAAETPSDEKPLRLVVQVGAFAESTRAQEVRRKIEAAGMKTYTHVAQTAEGQRIRVRLGPFSNRAEADKAAERVKALGYPAAILTL